MSGKYIVDSIRSFEYMDKQLGRLRQWLEGFRQGGGQIPHDIDVLRQCQIALSSGKALRTPADATSALRSLSRSFDELENCLDGAREKLALVEGLFGEAASAIEARSGETTQIGSTEGESAVAKPDAQGPAR